MRKYLFFIICLAPGLVVIPFGAFADAKIKLSQITPRIVRQNDIKLLSIKGSGFQKGAGLDLEEGITVLSAEITHKKIKAHITVDLDASTGKRDVVITNPSGEKGQKKRGLQVRKCAENCEELKPFEGNSIPIHDKNSSQYRTDCTNAACHRNKLKETSLDSSIMTFHVLKVLDPNFSKFFGKTTDKNAYIAIKAQTL